MPLNNLFRCCNCNTLLISEERENHVCYDDKILFDTNGTFSLDGKKWYRWSPTENQQRKSNTDKSTEPNLNIIYSNIYSII
jgi:hypothetical protein